MLESGRVGTPCPCDDLVDTDNIAQGTPHLAQAFAAIRKKYQTEYREGPVELAVAPGWKEPRQNITISTLEQIAKALRCHVCDLLKTTMDGK